MKKRTKISFISKHQRNSFFLHHIQDDEWSSLRSLCQSSGWSVSQLTCMPWICLSSFSSICLFNNSNSLPGYVVFLTVCLFVCVCERSCEKRLHAPLLCKARRERGWRKENDDNIEGIGRKQETTTQAENYKDNGKKWRNWKACEKSPI